MALPYSDSDKQRALQTLMSIQETIDTLLEWNSRITSTEDYYGSQSGMQLLTANCTLITAIGEGINRINKILPEFLQSYFPDTPWRAIIGMRNHIAHGYFNLDADLVFEAVSQDIPPLHHILSKAINLIRES